MPIETNQSTANDGLKVSSEATINTFKQTYNQFISKLKDTTVVNLFINPTMKHIMGSAGTMPFAWNIDPIESGNITFANTNSAPLISYGRAIRPAAPTQILFNNLAGRTYQTIFQVISQRLKPNTEYTLAFAIAPSADCKVSLEHDISGGLSDLRSSTNINNVFESIFDNVTAGVVYEDYFNFVTSDTISSVEFHITSTNAAQINPANIIEVHRLYLFEGGIEFTNGFTRDDFEDNVQYNVSSGQWELTEDGVNYRPILTAGDLPDTINLDGKVNTLTFAMEHDLTSGRHKTLSLVDNDFQVAYRLGVVNRQLTLTSPNVYQVTPSLGEWSSTRTYNQGEIITYQNMKWKSRVNGNLANDPSVYSTDKWENIPDGVFVTVDNTFPDYLAAYYSSHLQTTAGDANNGIHAFPDVVQYGLYRTMNLTNPTPLLANMPATVTNTNAVGLLTSFLAQHDVTGEHIFTIGGVTKKLQLTVNHTTGVKTLSFVNYTRATTPQLTTTSFSAVFTSTTPTVFHDANGNHFIKDTDGNVWQLVNSNGAFSFIPTATTADIIDKFQTFRKEHDKYGRHILRDVATGVFYHVYVNPTTNQINIDQTVFEPVEDINQFLSVYNMEHDINGDHHIRTKDLTSSRKVTYLLTIIDNVVMEQEFVVDSSPSTPVPQYHPARTMVNDSMHTNPTIDRVHIFKINNGSIL